ncbi:MAG: hypothetical protein FJY98_00640 [Candidatus Liptonbacteria bacterium]|nr:hypothetical protein [Candidatus Liptonbacteria bacterium]
MIRLIVVIGILGVLTAGFSWWRFGTLEQLPPTSSAPSSTVELPPVTADREELIRFENEILAQKIKDLPTSTPRKSAEAVPASSSPPATKPAVREEPPVAASPAVSASTSSQSNSPSASPAATTTSPASAPAPSTPELQQFMLVGSGYCEYKKGISSVLLSGYPFVIDYAIPDDNIKEWTPNRIIFTTPNSVPPGTYMINVRGVDWAGYCTQATSSVDRITVK